MQPIASTFDQSHQRQPQIFVCELDFPLTLLWHLSKEGQVALGHFLGLQIK